MQSNSYNIVALSRGRFELILDVSLTSGDVEELIAVVEHHLHYVGGILSEFPGLTQHSYFSIHISSRAFSRTRDRFNFRRNFEARRISDREDLYEEFRDWAYSFTGDNIDYTVDIQEIVVNLHPENAGGCGGNARTHIRQGALYHSPQSVRNNCFFKCISELMEGKKTTLRFCNDLRKRINVLRDQPIPASLASALFPEICIQDSESDVVHGNPDSPIVLLLEGGHYLRRVGVVHTHECSLCGVVYKHSHKCPRLIYKRCEACNKYHDGSCKVYDVEWYVNRVQGLSQKYLRIPNNESGYISKEFILHYDIETFPVKGVHTPYIVGFYIAENSYTAGSFSTFTGKDCMTKFVQFVLNEWSRKFPKRQKCYVNAFNGAAFDHYFFIKECARLKEPIGNFAMSHGSIVRAEIRNVVLCDIAKHTNGSLKSNLLSLGCKVQKGDFDHSKATYWENMSEPMRIDCLRYLSADVYGLAELYEKLSNTTEKLYGISLCGYISTSQLTFTLWRQFALKKQWTISLPNMVQEEYYRGAIYGGRCYKSKNHFYSSDREAFLDGDIDYEHIQDYLMDLDVVSLYPSAMKFYPYPLGPPTSLTTENIASWNTLLQNKNVPYLSILHIRFIPNKRLAHAVLPRRVHKTLVWDLEDGEGYYTSIDIENALRFGYSIIITSRGGFYWRSQEFIFTEYIDDLYDRKRAAEKGSPAYLLAKLFMNGLYGKMIQRPVYSRSKWFKTNHDVVEFFNSNHVFEMEFIGELTYAAGYPKNDLVKEGCIQKPTYLGAFILSYSRRLMLDYFSLSNPHFSSDSSSQQQLNDFYYTDTDSIHVHVSNRLTLSEDLGGITSDIGEAKILKAIYIAPKLYMLEYVTAKDRSLHYHFKGKGIHSEALNIETYEYLRQGFAVQTCKPFAMKRIATRRNGKQQDIECFSIVHEEWDKTCRFLGTEDWCGRLFGENYSFPKGSDFAQHLLWNECGLPLSPS